MIPQELIILSQEIDTHSLSTERHQMPPKNIKQDTHIYECHPIPSKRNSAINLIDTWGMLELNPIAGWHHNLRRNLGTVR